MQETTNFDQVAYWLDRHEKLRGDHRATGNITTSHAEMLHRKLYQAYLFSTIANMLRDTVLPGGVRLATVLDIGFGTGFLASILSNTGFIYTGFDLSAIAVEDASRLAPSANLFVKNIVYDSAPISDIIFASEVLFHIVDDEQWLAAIKNISSAMHSRSILIFTETFVSSMTKSPPHFRPRTRSLYEEAFSKCGLRFNDSELPLSNMPVFAENLTFMKSFHFAAKS